MSISINRRTTYIIFGGLAIILALLSLPLFTQTHIYVEVLQNNITDVYVKTPQVSIISTLSPLSLVDERGINTIIITVQQTGQEFMINDVPNGKYAKVWVSDGLPPTGTYTIEVELFQNNLSIDTFDLTVSF